MRILKNTKGFTLLEILVAISILTTVLVTVFAAYTGTFRLVKDTGREGKIYSMARTALKRMGEDLESACTYRKSFRFVSNQAEDPDLMELSFLSSAHLDFDKESSSALTIVSYFLEEEEETGAWTLKRKDDLFFEPPEGMEEDETRDAGYILCEGLDSLKYKFYDINGDEYESWDFESDSSVQNGNIPSIVSIEMNFANPYDKDNPYRFFTKVFLPARAEE